MAVVLLGNGLNQCEGLACSWSELLETAVRDARKSKTTEKSEKSVLPSVDGLTMTLGFDLQEFYSIDNGLAESGTDLKRKIANSLQTHMQARMKGHAEESLRKPEINTAEKTQEQPFRWEDTLHYELMRLPVETFMTTNYDYALEYAVDLEFQGAKGSGETTYSRYRKHMVGAGNAKKIVYHIHGELNVPRSICLGFEQYSSSLAKIRTDLVHSTRNINDAKDPHTFHLKDVMLGLKKANGEDEDDGTWYLKFFKEDVYILGFGLDLSEQDIWWLLDYRIRQKKYEKTNLGIENKIVFFDSDSSSEELEEKYKPRNNLLRAFDVEIVYLSGDSFREKFQRAIGYIRKDLETKGIL